MRPARRDAVFGFLAAAVICYWLGWYGPHHAGIQQSFGVVLDAGSSGTRVYVYSWTEGRELDTIQELFRRKVKPGLSSFADRLSDVSASLQELLGDAVKHIPRERRSSSPILLKATAGLRLLPPRAQANILQVVRTVLQDSPFRFQDAWAEIIDGTVEARFDWLTVAIAHGRSRADGSRLIGALDLGGASTQIAFPIVRADKAAAHAGGGAVSQIVQLPGPTDSTGPREAIELYAVSRLSFGLTEAFQRFIARTRGEATLAEGEDRGGTECPCLASGLVLDLRVGHGHGDSNPDFLGTGNPDACAAAVTTFVEELESRDVGGMGLTGGTAGTRHQMDAFGVRATRLFYAMDNYYKFAVLLTYRPHGKPSPIPTSLVVTVNDLEEGAKWLCALPWQELRATFPDKPDRFLRRACFAGMYIVTLLTSVYGLGSTTQLQCADEIAGFDASWPLGAMVDNLLTTQ